MTFRLGALLAMAAFGVAVYLGLGSLKSPTVARVKLPTGDARIDVAGTMFVVQEGVLYRIRGGVAVKLAPGPAGTWLQPALEPDHNHLVAVLRSGDHSDVYELDLDGHVVRQLTSDDVKGSRDGLAHWAFYPRVSADGTSLYYSYDAPKYRDDYRVDLAVWDLPLVGGQRLARRQSTFNDYTGGDTFPIPLAGGAILYSKYGVGLKGPYSQLWYQARTMSAGKALTQPDDDCGQPALSPDGGRVAMICTSGSQAARLQVASFDPVAGLGDPVTLASGLLGAESWAPDGRSLAYLAASGSAHRFQLWTVALPAATTAASPGVAPLARQLTFNLDLDGTSAPAWM